MKGDGAGRLVLLLHYLPYGKKLIPLPMATSAIAGLSATILRVKADSSRHTRCAALANPDQRELKLELCTSRE